MRTDTERLNALEALTGQGACPALIFDDNGHWAVSEEGVQSIAAGSETVDVQTTFFVPAKDWKPSIREAIDAYLDAQEGE